MLDIPSFKVIFSTSALFCFYLKERQTDIDILSAGSPPKGPNSRGSARLKLGTQSRPPCGWQGPNHLRHHPLPLRLPTSRKLDLNQGTPIALTPPPPALLTFWTGYFSAVKCCSVYYRMFSCIPVAFISLLPLPSVTLFIHPEVKIKKSSDIANCTLEGKICPGWEPLI